jgi:hypothetical protein
VNLFVQEKKLSKFVKTKDSVRGEEMTKRFEMIDTKRGSNLTNKHLFFPFNNLHNIKVLVPIKNHLLYSLLLDLKLVYIHVIMCLIFIK